MVKELIHIDKDNVGRLCCDNPRCKHILPIAMAWGPELIGFRCPKCNSDMLTVADYNATERIFYWIGWLNKWFGPLFGHEHKPNDPRYETVHLQHHDGKTTITKKG